MCTILLAFQQNKTPLVLLANRDEFYNRPTAPAAAWEETPGMIAGRDLASGGTWLGVRGIRWATVTNVREGIRDRDSHHRSRGWLVRDFLQGDLAPHDYLQQLNDKKSDFAGYNLLIGDSREIWYASNRITEARRLTPGIYGLSNHLLDSPWPKVQRGKKGLKKLLDNSALDHNAAFALLADTTRADDKNLPDTGIPLEWERALSATFIRMPEYGTRCSTLYTLQEDGSYQLTERRFTHDKPEWDESSFSWHAPGSLLDR